MAAFAGASYGGYFAFKTFNSPEFQWQLIQSDLAEQDWESAHKRLSKFIKVNPAHADAYLALADVVTAVKKDEFDADPDNRDATFREPRSAITHLMQAAQLRTDDVDVRARLFRNFMLYDSEDSAREVARELARLGHNDPDVLALSVESVIHEKRWDLAEQWLDRLGKASSRRSATYLLLRIQLHEQRGDSDRLDEFLAPTLVDMSRMPLDDWEASDMESIGPILEAAIRSVADGMTLDNRLLQSLNIIERLMQTKAGTSRRPQLVELAASLVAIVEEIHPTQRDGLSKQAGETSGEDRLLARELFVRLAGAELEAGLVSPEVYEQLVYNDFAIGQYARVLTLLHRGIEQHRQLPTERQRQLLVTYRGCVLQLLSEGQLRAAEASIQPLLKHEYSATLGHLVEAIWAVDEGQLKDAAVHLAKARLVPTQTIAADALQIRIDLTTGNWLKALVVLQAIDKKWNTLSTGDRQWLAALLGDRLRQQFLQGYCYLQLGQSEWATMLLAQLDQGPLRSRARQLRVIDLLRRKRGGDAAALLRASRRDDPRDVDLLLMDFGWLIWDGDSEKATDMLTNHLEEYPGSPRVRIVLAQWLHMRGDREQASEQLAETLRIFPDLAAPWLMSADLMLAGNQDQKLTELLESLRDVQAVAHLVPLILAHRNLRRAGLNEAAEVLRQEDPRFQQMADYSAAPALMAMASRDPQRPLELFCGSLKFTGANPRVMRGFLNELEQALIVENPAGISAAIDSLLGQFPNRPALLLASTEIAISQGDFRTAAERVHQLRIHDPVSGRPGYTQARLLVAMGLTVEALAELDAVFEEAPTHQQAHVLAARLFFDAGNWARALTHLDALPTGGANDIDLRLMRGDILAGLNRAMDAKSVFDSLTRDQPDYLRPWLALASVQESEGRADNAARTLARALKNSPDDPQLQTALLDLLLRTKNVAKAQEAANRFVRSKDSMEVVLRLARAYLSARELEQGIEWLQKARTRVDGSIQSEDEILYLEALYHQHLASRNINERDALLRTAREKYIQLIKRNSTHVQALYNLAWLLLEDFQEPANALVVIEKLRAIPDDQLTPEVIDTVVGIYRRLGRSGDALSLVTTALTQHPNSALLRLQHGLLLLDQAGSNVSMRDRSFQELDRARQLGLPENRMSVLNKALAMFELN